MTCRRPTLAETALAGGPEHGERVRRASGPINN
jgi:hypothetical protein